MSIDYYVYTKDLVCFSVEDFFKYAQTHGVKLRTECDFRITEYEGFIPFLLNIDFIDSISIDNTFLSGFEIYTSEYTPTKYEPIKPTFFQKLFDKIPVQPEPTRFDIAVSGLDTQIFLNCSSADSFKIFLTYILGAYFCKNGGVFDDPQLGCFYDNYEDIEFQIQLLKEDLKELAKNGELCTHSHS